MDHCPRDWHDLVMHNDFAVDTTMRRLLIDRGIYTFPLATKQCSISAAHSETDIDLTLKMMEEVLGNAVETGEDAVIAVSK
jgi:glutamate-1-semialdehyde 2,1-aminomutase